MAENKKSIIVYADWMELFDALQDDEAGRLIKHFFRYVNDLDPKAPDRITELSFIQIKQSLKRDLKKYENYINKQKTNGLKGGRPKAKETQITQPFISEPKKADSDSDSDSVNDSETKKLYIYTEKDFLERWKSARLHYDKKPTNISKLTAIESVDFNNILKIYLPKQIDEAIGGLFAQDTYKDTRLRPSHFLRLENFEKYLTCWQTNEVLFPKKTKAAERL